MIGHLHTKACITCHVLNLSHQSGFFTGRFEAILRQAMSSRLVKKQLAALQQGRPGSDSLHPRAAAPKKKRLRPRDKRKQAQKAQKALDNQRDIETIVLKNIKYFKSTSQTKATAQASAVMANVCRHRCLCDTGGPVSPLVLL